MSINYNRTIKVVLGSSLIGITLTASHTAGSVIGLYALVGIPIVFSGLFDWKPMETAVNKFTGYLLSLSKPEPVGKVSTV